MRKFFGIWERRKKSGKETSTLTMLFLYRQFINNPKRFKAESLILSVHIAKSLALPLKKGAGGVATTRLPTCSPMNNP